MIYLYKNLEELVEKNVHKLRLPKFF